MLLVKKTIRPAICQMRPAEYLNEDDAQKMASRLREGLKAKVIEEPLEGVAGMDEVHVVTGHKGNPAAVQKKVALDDGEGSGARGGAGHWKRKSRRSSA